MPQRPPRQCPTCRTLHTGQCPTCRTTRDQRRGTKTQRLGPGWDTLSRHIIARDNGICHICRRPGANTTDHITPRAQGGTNDPANLAAAHRTCNSRKADH